MVYVSRSIWTLAGLSLLSLAFIAEFQQGLLATAVAGGPGFIRGAVEGLFARELLLHLVAAMAALAGFFVFATSWPVLISLTVLLGRVAVSAVGAVLIAAALVAALDQTFFGLFAEPQGPAVDGESGGAVIVYAAAAMLGFIGLTIAVAPWRRTAA
jgi:hypothetical protein